MPRVGGGLPVPRQNPLTSACRSSLCARGAPGAAPVLESQSTSSQTNHQTLVQFPLWAGHKERSWDPEICLKKYFPQAERMNASKTEYLKYFQDHI